MKTIVMFLMAVIMVNFTVTAATQKGSTTKKIQTVRIVKKGKAPRKVVNVTPVPVSDSLIKSLVKVETGGDRTKIGNAGEIGILQILPCVIDDVNNLVEHKKTYVIDDALDDAKAKEICRKYLGYWGAVYQKREGMKVTDQILSRIWNGGPTGYKKYATVCYWTKVNKALRSIA